jgi:hypothetical protein
MAELLYATSTFCAIAPEGTFGLELSAYIAAARSDASSASTDAGRGPRWS